MKWSNSLVAIHSHYPASLERHPAVTATEQCWCPFLPAFILFSGGNGLLRSFAHEVSRSFISPTCNPVDCWSSAACSGISERKGKQMYMLKCAHLDFYGPTPVQYVAWIVCKGLFINMQVVFIWFVGKIISLKIGDVTTITTIINCLSQDPQL